MNTLRDKIRGAMWGALVGDAAGVPYEFRRADTIPPSNKIAMGALEYDAHQYPPTHNMPAGTWSDDGSGVLALASACLGATTHFEPEALAAGLVAWYKDGAFAVDGHVFDIGNATRSAINKLIRGASWKESGCSEASSNGNGSLMRAIPLALWHVGTDAELYRDAVAASAVTHAHALATTSCGLFSILVRKILLDRYTPATCAIFAAQQVAEIDPANFDQLDRELRKYEVPNGRPMGSGYVVDSLAYALRIAKDYAKHDFTSVVRGAIRLGGDTDTTASIAGGLAGAIYGVQGIPSLWLSAMRDDGQAAKIIERLAAGRT